MSIASALAKPPLGGPHLLSEHIFPIITTLAKDTTQEEYRVEAAQVRKFHFPTLPDSLIDIAAGSPSCISNGARAVCRVCVTSTAQAFRRYISYS